MRIALFSETFAPQRNGVALVLERAARYLTDRGHEVLVVTARADPPGLPESRPPLGVRVVKVPGVRLPRYPDLTIAAPFFPGVLRRVRAFQPQVIHLATEYSLGLTGLWISRRLRVPALASFHTDIPGFLPHYGLGWASEACWRYLRWFHRQAGLTLAPSEVSRAQLVRRGFGNVRVWGRGVDSARFAPAEDGETAPRRNGGANGVRLLYVGRLTPEKGLDVLFQAYREARAVRPDVSLELVLAGDGAYAGRARRAAPAGVIFAGYLEGAALSAAYARADVFVFPSSVETLGNVVLEAMASGLPVIGADRGGTLENVRHQQNGLLVAAGDVGGFASAILRLALDAGLRQRLGKNARARAETRTWDQAMETLVATYQEIASSTQHGSSQHVGHLPGELPRRDTLRRELRDEAGRQEQGQARAGDGPQRTLHLVAKHDRRSAGAQQNDPPRAVTVAAGNCVCRTFARCLRSAGSWGSSSRCTTMITHRPTSTCDTGSTGLYWKSAGARCWQACCRDACWVW